MGCGGLGWCWLDSVVFFCLAGDLWAYLFGACVGLFGLFGCAFAGVLIWVGVILLV